MLEKDILLIINPNASKGKGRKKAHEIKDAFQRNSRQCTIAYTKGPGHASILARKGVLYEYNVIVAAGGDGLILSNRSEKVDVGLCVGTDHKEGLYFFNGAGFGFEPVVNFRAMGYRHLNGMPSYVAAFIYILFHFPSPYHVNITIDGEERTLVTQQISVCNGRRMGSSFLLAPKARLNDGLFDLMYTTHPFSSTGEILRAALAFLRGSHVSDSDDFAYMNARHVLIESAEGNMEAHCDGEVFSRAGSRFELTIQPSALELIHGKEKC